MKNLVLTLLIAVLTVGTVAAQEINWVTLEEAIELQKKKERKERNYGFIVDITVVQVQNAIYFFVNDKTKNNIE